jgi:hypothetical protein
MVAEAEAAHMLKGNSTRPQVQVRTGFRGEKREMSILDRYFGPEPGRRVRVIR